MIGLSSRRGSALLVVLGMLSFMVISGLAFSIFMRTTRLSSSFTRRAVTTRQLAKAALAEAIDQIDRAIGNDPHPNVRLNDANKYNHWVGRVLVAGEGSALSWKEPDLVANDLRNDRGCEGTVPVLSLEALAYIPPPLVNEARYYGQMTPTASWQSFNYDAGRYAFIALDVSDYFDVNRVLANEARSSHPARRVNIAHLFEGGGEEHNSKPTRAAAWETFMEQFRAVDDDGNITFNNTPPFVSLADLNLSLHTQVGGFISPFVQYLENQGGEGFYGVGPDDETWDAYSRMTFVTDSLAAHEDHDHGDDSFDLDTDEGQPYSDAFMNRSLTSRSASRILDDCTGRQSWEYLKNRVSACGMIALCDYLDKDDVPTSLALPTVERVPMVCAVRPMVSGLKVVIDREVEQTTKNEIPQVSRELELKVTYRYKLEGSVNVDAWTAFPFRDRDGFVDSYKADCRLAMFLSSEEMRLRTSDPRGSDDLLRSPGLSTSGLKNGIVNLVVTDKGCPTKTVTKPEDVVKQTDGFEFGDASSVFTGDQANGIVLFDATFVCKQTWDDKSETWTPEPNNQNYLLKAAPTCDFSPILANGQADSKGFANIIAGNKEGTSIDALQLPANPLRFNLATWIAVHNSKVVDLVPACLSDDREYNGMEYNDDFTDGVFDKVSGVNAPLLKFSESGATAEISIFDKGDFLKSGGLQEHEITLAHPEGLVIRDPRYNHAPENWFAATAPIDASGAYWLNNADCSQAGCDGDVFMAVSDQEKMQSIAELAFLPRFTDLNNLPSDRDAGNRISNPERSTWMDYPTKGNEAQANMMWRTFNPFDERHCVDNVEGFELLQEVFHHHGKGQRVNPYSDSTNVIMAAFANAPVSWRVASDNEDENPVASSQTTVEDFNSKYAWNDYAPAESKVSWADLSDVAGAFMEHVRARAKEGKSWETALQYLFCDDWADTPAGGGSGNLGDPEKHLGGIELERNGRFYSVDKKMLWGFWQNSFEPQQQLFLVFFRSEPTMLGGGVAGVTPPQLGAKGVALVWRNPNATSGSVRGFVSRGEIDTNYKPHQTRVLFYRQFE